jgi:hypothetical protein
VRQRNKSFLLLFFKKEALGLRLVSPLESVTLLLPSSRAALLRRGDPEPKDERLL